MTLALTRPLPRERRRLLPYFDESLDHGRVPAFVKIRPRSYRFVPASTAWYRLVPDKFFLRVIAGEKIGVPDCGCGLQERNLWGWAAWGRLRPLERKGRFSAD